MMQGLKGKAAIVTGGSTGIGRAVMERLCAEGVSVTYSGISDGGVATERECRQKGYEVQFLRGDMAEVSLYVFGNEFTGDSVDRVLETVDRLNRPDRSGERKVPIHAIGFPTIFFQARFGENTGVRFAILMRLLCQQNGGASVALNSLTP